MAKEIGEASEGWFVDGFVNVASPRSGGSCSRGVLGKGLATKSGARAVVYREGDVKGDGGKARCTWLRTE